MIVEKEIHKLERRREMAAYQRKITTQIATVWEYDAEIVAIDKKIVELKLKQKCTT